MKGLPSLASIASFVAAAAAFISSLHNRGKLQDVKLSMDGRLDELLETTRKLAYAAGVKSEADKGKKPNK